MRQRVLALCLAGILAAGGLVGCGKKAETANATQTKTAGYAKDAKLKVWGSQEDQEMYGELIKRFKAETPEAAGWNVELAVVMGADAKNELLKDASAAADVFDFASDQIMELQAANALYRITKNKDKIIANNSEESTKAAMVNGELYGYPTAATTFFMYYDKSMYTEEEVKNLNTMMAKKLPSGVANFSMDIDNGWFNSSFFQGAGCRLFGPDGLDPTQCDFNNEKGLMVGNYLADLVSSGKFANQDGTVLIKAFESKKLGAAIHGPWDAKPVEEALGKDYGVTTLPTLTLEDGSTVQLASMMNFNLTGINARTKYPAEAMLLAEYLTNNEKSLEYRFGLKPGAATNKNIAAKIAQDASNETMQALVKQTKFAVIQTSIPEIGKFWTPAEAFGAGLMDGSINRKNMQEKLDVLVKNVLAKIE